MNLQRFVATGLLAALGSIYFVGIASAAEKASPKLHFSASTPDETSAWQANARTLLFDLLK
ncbi:MAG: hypothetical protein IT427_03035, partial [Pirellulales bacterium]|nr:hypothetical protein [Pirellulales bacterium]